MLIELKNIKTFATDDGGAYSATVYLDGVKAGTVHQGGYGGPNEYAPDSLRLALEQYAKTLPPVAAYGQSFAQTPDILIDEALNHYEARRTVQRLLKGHILVLDNGRVTQTRKLDATRHAQCLSDPERYLKVPRASVLNLRPLDDVVALIEANQ